MGEQQGRSMRKVFIDCGFHHGEGLQQFIKMLEMDAGWIIYCFEPNPSCKALSRFGHEALQPFFRRGQVRLFDAAVWIHDHGVAFSQERYVESEDGPDRQMTDGWGSSVTSLQADIDGYELPIQVPSIDLSKMLETVSGSEVYVKMDIEGAEFPVLRKMLADDTVKHIKKLWVEFHDRFIPGESLQTRDDLIRQLARHTEVVQWL